MAAVFNPSGELEENLMSHSRVMTVFLAALLMCACVLALQAQYILPQDTIKRVEDEDSITTPSDSVKALSDSLKSLGDTTKAAKPAPKKGGLTTPEEETSTVSPDQVVKQANQWLKRMLFRGSFDASHIGAYASYQLTAWSDGTGSYGPVEARLTIYYLGSSVWETKDAEWLQAVYTVMDEEPMTIEYDFIVPAGSEIKDVYRVLYRIDGGEMRSASFAANPNSPDVDAADKPVSDGAEDIKLYTGSYQTEKFHGIGDNGTDVLVYRSNAVPPLDIVRLGYGDEALTLTSVGDDAAPRFDTPPPSGR
jgi:hypothetical protein